MAKDLDQVDLELKRLAEGVQPIRAKGLRPLDLKQVDLELEQLAQGRPAPGAVTKGKASLKNALSASDLFADTEALSLEGMEHLELDAEEARLLVGPGMSKMSLLESLEEPEELDAPPLEEQWDGDWEEDGGTEQRSPKTPSTDIEP